MRNFILTTMAVLTVSSCFSQTLLSQNDATQDKTPGEFQREIFVPFESLDILLDGNSNRVLLSRDEYTTLLKSARTREIKRAPFDSAVVSAKYTAVVFEGVAMIKGELIVEQLNEGLVQIPLPFSGVAIRSARLGDQPAKLWRNPKGEIVLLVSNQKRESLVVEMTVPMQTSAARQTMSIQLPSPSATKLSLNVPGNVEVKSGVPVVNRAYNEDNNTTNFDLLVTRKPMNIVMSLNNRLLKDEQVAVSRSVMIHKLTPHSQEIHVTCSLDVIHGALETVEFVVPADFQVSQVNTELMSQWKIKEPPTGSGETGTRLVVELRQPTREDFVLNITATRNQGVAGAWESKDIRPVDVAGHVSVVGVLADVELKSSKLNSEGVIPIDHEFLMAAIPDSVQSTNRGNSTTIVAAYYAPQREYSISASFSVPSPELIVKSNSRLVIDNQHLELQGGISLVSRHDSRFGFKLSLPNAWRLIELTGIDGQPIRFDRVGVEGRSQFLVHLPTRIPSAASTKVFFRASKTPDGWLEKWESNQIAFPMLMIDGETKHSGAIAISSDEDLAIKPLDESNLNLLDEADKKKFELSHDNAPLAYQFQNSNYKLNLELNRLKPSIIARTYNYATIKPTQMAVHAELIYDVKQASEGEFKFQLPLESPKSISITGVSNQLKDYRSEDTETAREWTVQLAKPRMGQVHLQIDYQMPLDESQLAELVLVPVAIRDVNFQSSMFAVEGSSELDIEIETEARSIDIGEFTAATYQPGRHLLGAYSWPNEEMSLTVKSLRRPVYALPSAIVQRAEMVTSISTNGKSQTAARFLLATKQQPFLRVELPANATLWSVQLDGEPAKPQLQGDALLISLIGSETGKLRNLQMVFEVPAEAFNLAGKVQANAPTLWLKNTNDSNGNQVPLVDLNWRLILPDGFAVSHDDGKFQSKQLVSRPSPIQQIGGWLFHLGGGNLLSHRNYQEKSVSGWGFYTPIDDSKSLASPEEQFAGRSSGDLYFLKDDVQFNQDMEEDSKKHNFDKEEAKKPAEDAPLSPAKISPPLGGQSRTVETRSAGQGLFGNSQTRDENKPASNWALSGLRSLNIELTETGNSIEFYNLGEQPSLNVTVINQSRLNWLAIALATLIAAIGVLLTNRRLKAKMFFIFTILVMACLVPLAGTSLDAFRTVIDLATLAAVGVAIYFVIAALIIRIGRSFSTVLAKIPLSLLVAAIAMGYGNESMAKQNPLDPFSGSQSDTTQLKQLITELQSPVKVELPKDAIIIPFDADDPQGREKADRLLLPYEHYLKLINKAELGAEPSKIVSPVDYILSSAKYDIQLTLDEDITIHGKLVIELMTDEPVAVALPLLGGALADANVDGKPAKLQFDGGSNLNRSTKMKASASVVQLHLNGRGQKTLEFTVRIKPSRQGGWRLLDARLPVGLTRELNLTSLAEATEIRLNSDSDQRSIEAKPKQQIETVLSANGTLRLQWKPSTATQIVDQSLTARSEAVFDVREDGLRLNWRVDLDFRGSERDLFTLNLPEEFLVEQVSGENIRAWSVQQEGNFSRLQLVTLSPAKDKESFTIELSRRDFTVDNTTTQFDAPYLTVEGAALHKGLYTVRRSPIIELKTTKQKSASRIDQNPSDSRIDMGVIDSKSSPLGIEAFQVLQFVTTPFQIGLQAQLVPRTIKAETQSVLRIGQTEAEIEMRINVDVGQRPIYKLSLDIPHDFEIRGLSAGLMESWTPELLDGIQRIQFFFPAGVANDFSIILDAKLKDYAGGDQWSIPKFRINDVTEQKGFIAVQVDPALAVTSSGLKNCETVLVKQVESWLNQSQRSTTRLVLRTKGADFDALLGFTKIEPRVTVETVTNVRTTLFAIEETILLDFNIQQAGIRQLQFELPIAMREARINAKLVSETVIDEVDANTVRVTLNLQDEVIDSYRVVIEYDRQLSDAQQSAPIPQVLTGVTEQRFVTLQNSGRDEINVLPTDDFQPLNRQLKQFSGLKRKLAGGEVTMAYAAQSNTDRPVLKYETRQRDVFDTVAASIDFSKTTMVVDSSGAYRALQNFQINNRSEQYLEIELPVGAQLLTVLVEGQPVKPVAWPTAQNERRLRIPLLKTQLGDLDYPVQLKYSGRLGDLSGFTEIEFPVIETLNINVQLSQLHLRLPDSHRWMNFGGTMSQVDDKGELEESFLSYKSRQIQQLAEQIQNTTSELGSFSSSRAYSSLNKIQQDMVDYESANPNFPSQPQGKQIRDLVIGNNFAIGRAQEQFNDRQSKSGELKIDNRANFNGLVEQQSAKISRNSINKQGQNFSIDQVEKGQNYNYKLPGKEAGISIKGKDELDKNWLNRNQLFNGRGTQYSGGKLSDNETPQKLMEIYPQAPIATFNPPQMEDSISFYNPIKGSESNNADEGLADSEVFDGPLRDGARRGMVGEITGRRGELSVGGFGGGGGGGGGGGRSELPDPRQSNRFNTKPSSSLQKDDSFAQMKDNAGNTTNLGPTQTKNSEGKPGPSLTSLDIQLPERGVDFYFKSPRGKATVIVRPLETRSISRWMSILITLAISIGFCLAAWIVYRMCQVRTLRFLAIAALFIAGLISLGTTTLPIYGLLAVVAAVIMLIDSVVHSVASVESSEPIL